MTNFGKLRNHLVETKTVSMSGAEQPQSEVILPTYGDIAGFTLVVKNSVTGTLVNAKTIDNAIKNIFCKDKAGNSLLQNIKGSDLLLLSRYRNKGRSRTIPTASSTEATETFYIPLNIERKDQEARMSVSIAPFSDMDDSGATGGSVTYSLYVSYYDRSGLVATEQIRKLTKTLNSGSNSYGIDLPKGITINNILFTIGTESNLNEIRFTGDGNKELDNVTTDYLTAYDEELLISGHVDGTFSLYNSPFFSTPASVLDFTASGSDTVELFVISDYTKPEAN